MKTDYLKNYRADSGFTLVEVLVSLAITSLIVGLTFGLVGQALKLNEVYAERERKTEERLTEAHVLKTFSNRLNLPLKLDGEGQPILFEGSSSSMRFSALALIGTNRFRVRNVRFFIRADGTLIEEHVSRTRLETDDQAVRQFTLIERFETKRFRYFSRERQAWSDSWSHTGTAPDAVDIR